ncbi:MAG: rhomboid family protein [Phycisphaerales bacterium]|nr:rhomboid family protein [Phycisphaerales bacterium]
MGIADRDYYRDTLPRAGFGHFSAWSVTTWLIAINVAVFFLDAILQRAHGTGIGPDAYDRFVPTSRFDRMGPLETWGYFSTLTAVTHLQVWRFFTFQFLHASPMHLIGNMFGIYLFGPIVEAHFGPRRYLAFYLLCGLAGAACYLLLAACHVLVTDQETPLVGASAGIFGLLVGAAMIAPDVQVFYYFFPFTVRTLAIIGFAMAAYTVIHYGGMPGAMNAGGEAAHLGGGILGFLLLKNQHWLNVFSPPRRTTARTATGPRRRVARSGQKDWSKDMNR